MKLNKRQKLKIVLKAKEIFEKDVKNCRRSALLLNGICEHLYDAMQELRIEHNCQRSTTIASTYFPEFYAMRPKDSTPYWWSTEVSNGVLPRRKALNKLIKIYSPIPRIKNN